MKLKLLYSFFLLAFCSILLLIPGCCKKRMAPPARIGSKKHKQTVSAHKKVAKDKKNNQSEVVTSPLPELEHTGLRYSISADNQKFKKRNAGNGYFESNYVKAVKLMSAHKYADAENIFDEICKRASDKEEASIAKLCIAEIYFRNKSNAMALRMYKEIVKKYPNTQAAENAKAGISYLTNFEKYEKEYISPDVEDKRRRGY